MVLIWTWMLVTLVDWAGGSTPANICPQSKPCVCTNDGFRRSEVVVNCERKKLYEIPTFEGIGGARKVNLAFNSISTILTFAFREITTKEIDLSHNSLSDLDDNAFTGLENDLETLNLKSNKFTSIPTSSLKILRKLKVLNLESNQRLESLTASAFEGLKSLEKLSLKQCHITTIAPGSFVGLHNLRELTLYENYITNVTSEMFSPLKNLLNLDLGYNGLQHIPARAFANINTLGLSMNNFSADDSFDPAAFKGIEDSLTYLSLAHCRMKTVPTGALNVLRAVKQISLTGNKIKLIRRGDLRGLKSLEHLTLDQNDGLSFHPRALSNIGITLRQLSMRNIGLKRLPLSVLQQLIALEWLDISGNKIESFEARSFEGLCATQYQITDSTVRDISRDAFKNTPNNLVINLQGNTIRDVDFLEAPCKFKEVNVDLYCDCQLYHLLTNRKTRITGKCRLPRDLENLPISSQEYRNISRDRCASENSNLEDISPKICPLFNQSETGTLAPSRCLSLDRVSLASGAAAVRRLSSVPLVFVSVTLTFVLHKFLLHR